MDDVLIFVSKNKKWDYQKFLAAFTESECYWKPLRLEPAEEGEFLETKFHKEGKYVTYRLKKEERECVREYM